MIDLHCHVLPGIDDGASTMAEASTMLAQSYDLGYTTVAATPHLIEPLSEENEQAIAIAHHRVKALATALDIEFVQGFEVLLTQDVPARLELGEPMTLGRSRALLVELPFIGWPMHANDTLFALQTAGFRPILAHPERYLALQEAPARGDDLADRGVILQVNISSLTGGFGKAAKRVAEHWLTSGRVGLVASDAHSSGTRMRAIGAGVNTITELVGADESQRLTTTTPRALLDDDALPPSVAVARPVQDRRRWWMPGW